MFGAYCALRKNGPRAKITDVVLVKYDLDQTVLYGGLFSRLDGFAEAGYALGVRNAGNFVSRNFPGYHAQWRPLHNKPSIRKLRYLLEKRKRKPNLITKNMSALFPFPVEYTR